MKEKTVMSIWNTVTVARTGRAGLACLAGFALVILPASFAQATYGPKTTIGTNYLQWSDTQSYDAANEGSCNGYRSCSILFQRVPQGKSLIVRHVSCRVSVEPGELSHGLLAVRRGQTIPDRYPYLLPVNTSGTQWVVSHPVTHLVKSNERPHIHFRTDNDSDWSLACNISGQLVEP